MTLNTKEQELLDTWNKIQEGKKNGENVNAINYNFQSTLSDLIDTQVREEGGEGNPLTDEDLEHDDTTNPVRDATAKPPS